MRETQFVQIAKALADPTRKRMLDKIREAGSLTCTQVCACFARSQPTISHHVKTLEAAGLVSVRREGAFHILTVDEETLAAFAARLLPQGVPVKTGRSKGRGGRGAGTT
jgi:ArsR family transcriptional regulator